MAWKELLQLHGEPKENTTPQPGDEAPDRGSLIQQARRLIGNSADAPAQTDDFGAEQVQVICRDGYVRRSPLQPYRIADDYQRRRIRKALTAVIVLIVIVLLVLMLMKTGLLVFRLR